jgi:phage-related protein
MWSTHIQPTIQAIGDALAPALETLGSLWQNLSVIIDDVFSSIGDAWTLVIKPAIEGAMEIIQDLCEIIEEWWTEYFGPVFEYIGDGIEELWKDKIKPVIDKIIKIIGKVVELIMALWNTVLKPIVEWIGKVLGPVFVAVFEAIWDGVSWAIKLVMNIIKSLLQSLEGIIDFLTGVFAFRCVRDCALSINQIRLQLQYMRFFVKEISRGFARTAVG